MNQVTERANALFQSASKSHKLAEDLTASDFSVQFRPLDEPAFHIRIWRQGYTLSPGAGVPEADHEAICVVEVRPCLSDLFDGEATLGNMLFDHKIQIPGYRNKEPLIGAFSRFLRRAVWATIPGATILRPDK